jgi:hypothetical protein
LNIKKQETHLTVHEHDDDDDDDEIAPKVALKQIGQLMRRIR